MAHSFSIVYGSVTISLEHVLSYNPISEPQGVETVSETMQLITDRGTTVADMQSLQQSLDRAFVQARRYADERIGDRVYLHFQADGAASTYRSPIRAGKAMLTDNALDSFWRNGILRSMVVFTRDNWWENTTETEVQCSNSNTAATTGGVTVYCHDDAGTGHDNYVQIAAAQIPGGLPTPPRLEITHTYATTECGDVFVNLNSFASPSTFSHILEAESATGYNTTSTPADASCSNGAYRSVSWSGSSATKLMQWSLTSAQMAALKGNRVRLGVRFISTPNPVYIHWRVLFNGLTPITSTEDREIQLSSIYGMQQLGDLYLPPRNLGTGTYEGLTLVLYGRYPGGSSLSVDYVHMGVMDGARAYRYIAYGLGNNYRLNDDPSDDAVWVDTGAGTNRMPLYNKPEGTMMLEPNTTQRLYFMARSATGGAPIERTFSVRAYIRDRKASV